MSDRGRAEESRRETERIDSEVGLQQLGSQKDCQVGFNET